MRNKVAKKLRREAENVTIGKPAKETRKQYKKLKKEFKKSKHILVDINRKIA